MLWKLYEMTVERLRALEKFVQSSHNRTTVLQWTPNRESPKGGYWSVVQSGRPLVEIMPDSCRLSPDTGYYRIDLQVHEMERYADAPEGEKGQPVLSTHFMMLLEALCIFPKVPPSGHGGAIDPTQVEEKLHKWGAPLPDFARPKRAEPKSGAGEPASATDTAKATPTASEPTWEMIRDALAKERGSHTLAARRLGIDVETVQRAAEEHSA